MREMREREREAKGGEWVQVLWGEKLAKELIKKVVSVQPFAPLLILLCKLPILV